jgi:hypothetical protein
MIKSRRIQETRNEVKCIQSLERHFYRHSGGSEGNLAPSYCGSVPEPVLDAIGIIDEMIY